MNDDVLIAGASGYLGGVIRGALLGASVLDDDVAFAGADAIGDFIGRRRPRVIVNAAGATRGTESDLLAANVEFPAFLTAAADDVGAHIVHLGSAAEYGLFHEAGFFSEDLEPAPDSAYGKTKLSGTNEVLRAKSSTVLRVFNLAANPAQAGSPLADIIRRTSLAVSSGQPVNLYSPDTVRDWVAPGFVVNSVVAAVVLRPRGVYNVCSGIGVRMGNAVEHALGFLGSTCEVAPSRHPGGTPVIGDPSRWVAASGLRETITAEALGEIIGRQVAKLLAGK